MHVFSGLVSWHVVPYKELGTFYSALEPYTVLTLLSALGLWVTYTGE